VKIACPHCQFPSRKELFVYASFATFGSPEDKEYEKVNKRVTKIMNHTRSQLENLEKYNQYVDKKNEIVYKLYNKIDLPELEANLESFELSNRATIAQNNSNPVINPKEKATYMIEELKRISKIRLKRERLVDQYCRNFIDEKEFAQQTQDLVKETSSGNAPVQHKDLMTDIKEQRSFSYTPHESSKSMMLEQAFQYPKPIQADMTLEKAKFLSVKKLNTPQLFHLSKEAGGWSSTTVTTRYKEYAFSCLSTTTNDAF
jgi:hypothetical protein